MIYNYCKAIVEPLKEDPDKWNRALKTAQQELDMLDAEFCKVWTWCCGCKDYAKLKDAYVVELPVVTYTGKSFGVSKEPRTVMKCGKCHSIWKMLD